MLPRAEPPFLALYSLLWHRHALQQRGGPPPPLSSFSSCWAAYQEFFSLAGGGGFSEVRLPMLWVYDILSEFVYLFEMFQRRLQALGAGAVDVPRDVWALPGVLARLHGLVDASGVAAPGAAAVTADARDFRVVCGYMAALCLVRMYGKLADYGSALEVARPLGLGNPDAPYARLHVAHATLVYYASFALLQSRRYEEALRLLSRSLRSLQQQCRVMDESDRAPTSDFLRKLTTKMLHLTAVAAASCPGIPVDDLVMKKIRERHPDLPDVLGDVADVPWRATARLLAEAAAAAEADAAASAGARAGLATVIEEESAAAAAAAAAAGGIGGGAAAGGEGGGEGAELEAQRAIVAAASAKLEKLFGEASPGFLAFTPAHLGTVEAAAASKVASEALTRSQLRLFKQEVFSRAAGSSRLRSVLRLYTSIQLAKLAAQAGLPEEDVRAALTAIKLKAGAAAVSAVEAGGVAGDALHFFMDGDVVYVEEARRADNVGAFFVNQMRFVCVTAQRRLARAPPPPRYNANSTS